MSEEKDEWIPLAALGAPEQPETDIPADLPLAYIPKFPALSSAQELLERSVAWGRR